MSVADCVAGDLEVEDGSTVYGHCPGELACNDDNTQCYWPSVGEFYYSFNSVDEFWF